jgi:hypothetical protein
MKLIKILLPVLLGITFSAKAQKIDSIFVNLYTDSLKKGTYNYINIDGLLSSGRYIPLDSNQLIFKSSYGKFYGNSLLIERDCKVDKVKINPAVAREFVMYIKTKEDNEKLPTAEELLEKMKKKG